MLKILSGLNHKFQDPDSIEGKMARNKLLQKKLNLKNKAQQLTNEQKRTLALMKSLDNVNPTVSKQSSTFIVFYFILLYFNVCCL